MYTRDEKARYANLAWPELVLVARGIHPHNIIRYIIRYGILGNRIGISNPRMVHHALSPIQNYCHAHDEIPHLTSLVVNRSKNPGAGFIPKLETAAEDRDTVYVFNWEAYPNPGYAILLEHATE